MSLTRGTSTREKRKVSLNPVTDAWRARLLAGLVISCLLAGCALRPAEPASQPTAGVATYAAPSPTLLPSATLEPTQVASTPESAAPTPVPGAASLVSLRGDGVFVGDGWGAQSRQVLSLGPATSMAVRGERLAYVVDGSILLADLSGAAPRRVGDAPPAFLLGPDLVWTDDGQALLTVADREDASATQTGRSIDVGVVTLSDGTWRPGLALADRAGATILSADGATGQVLLVPWGAEPSFKEALRYDLSNGQLVASLPIAGEGEIVPSPDGRLAVTTLFDEAQGVNTNLLYDLSEDTSPVRQRLPLNAGTHTVSHVWSPDGRRIAYLLRQGRAPSEAAEQALGIWIWDLENRKTAKVAEASDPSSGPVAWTPDGRYLIYRQVDAAGANAFYALDTTGNSVQRLPLHAASRILGWVGGGQ